MRAARLTILCLAVAALLASPAAAQDDGFFRGKTVTIIVGNSAGGLYDLTARLLGRHMPRHITGNPTVLVQNMPGAGSESAIHHLYSRAPKDGTQLGVVARGWAVEPILTPSSNYDSRRFNWIGSVTDEVSLAVVWHSAPAQTFEDLFTREIAVGGTAQGSDNNRIPRLLVNMMGARIRLINGYPGGNDITNAMEKGEVDGYFAWSWGAVKSRGMEWLESKKIRILLQVATRRAADLPDVPAIIDFARSDEDRQVIELLFAPLAFAWPMLAPPDLPAARVAALRRAYAETMRDPAMLADLARLNLDPNFMPGEEINKTIARLYGFSPDVVQKAIAYTTR